MSAHARLMPSKASQWVVCPGSVQMQERYPETERHEAAEEGTAAHEIASMVLQDFLAYGRHGHTFKRSDFIDRRMSNGVVATEEMLDAVETYVTDVMAVSGRFDGLSTVFLEHRVSMPWVHPDNWGTLDNAVLFHNRSSDTMVVTDFKYGYQIVEAYENWQLLDYAIGLLYDLCQPGRQVEPPKYIELRLVQPRPYHPLGPVRTWTIPVSALGGYIETLKAMAYEALGENPRCIPSAGCATCSGRHACLAATQSVYAGITVVTGVTPHELTGAALGAHLHLLTRIQDLVKAQLSGFESQALSLIQNGELVPGWEHARTNGRVVWTDKPIEELYQLGDLMGVDLRKHSAPTPKQAIEMGMPENVVGRFSVRNAGKIKLVPANNKMASAIFSK